MVGNKQSCIKNNDEIVSYLRQKNLIVFGQNSSKTVRKSQKSWVTNYKFFMHSQEVELCDGFHLKSVVRNPKVQIRPHEKARQQRQTLI